MRSARRRIAIPPFMRRSAGNPKSCLEAPCGRALVCGTRIASYHPCVAERERHAMDQRQVLHESVSGARPRTRSDGERGRSVDGVWTEEYPEPVQRRPVWDEDFWNDEPTGRKPVPEDNFWGDEPSSGTQQREDGGHWVTINGRHVLLDETRAGQGPNIRNEIPGILAEKQLTTTCLERRPPAGRSSTRTK